MTLFECNFDPLRRAATFVLALLVVCGLAVSGSSAAWAQAACCDAPMAGEECPVMPALDCAVICAACTAQAALVATPGSLRVVPMPVAMPVSDPPAHQIARRPDLPPPRGVASPELHSLTS